MFLAVVGASHCVPVAVVCNVYINFVAAAFLHQSLAFFCVSSNMLVSNMLVSAWFQICWFPQCIVWAQLKNVVLLKSRIIRY